MERTPQQVQGATRLTNRKKPGLACRENGPFKVVEKPHERSHKKKKRKQTP
jgi:hypothetical protein